MSQSADRQAARDGASNRRCKNGLQRCEFKRNLWVGWLVGWLRAKRKRERRMKQVLPAATIAFLTLPTLAGCDSRLAMQERRLQEIVGNRVESKSVKCLDLPIEKAPIVFMDRLGVLVKKNEAFFHLKIEPTDWAADAAQIALSSPNTKSICVGNAVQAWGRQVGFSGNTGVITEIIPYEAAK